MITKERGHHQDYAETLAAMQAFNRTRTASTPDELWLLEHNPVFTQGLAGKPEHALSTGDIPVVQTDRGGQITYHGPGQLVAYLLFDLRRLKMGPRDFVNAIEETIITTLKHYKIEAKGNLQARGVYVNGEKICSIGLRIRHGCSYHGIALNIDMDLEPFSRINPCGTKDLKITQITHFNPAITLNDVSETFAQCVREKFRYTPHTSSQEEER